jgi:DNA-3-methyladenine glycosylase
MKRLSRPFFGRPARQVARNLLGKRLVSIVEGRRVAGLIVETEAYCDTQERDMACHGDRVNNGYPTKRTAVMFGPPGYAYVYFTYGMHWMFNVVTGEPGQANAVLIRALEPTEGLDIMQELRGLSKQEFTNGPAKLAQALAINQVHNGLDLCETGGSIWIEEGIEVQADEIRTGPRIGLGKTPEPWLSVPWRYWIDENPYVSR